MPPLLIVALVGVVVLLLLAWTVPVGRLATVLTLVLTAVLLASPSWFLHYPGLATGPLCVALAARGAATRRTCRLGASPARAAPARPRRGDRPGPGLPADPVHRRQPLPGATLGRAATGAGCVTADDPAALVEMNVLGRDLASGCRFVADIGGYSYEVARRAGRATPRRDDPAWQQTYLDYLRTGNLSLPFRYGRSGSLSASTTSAIRRWPTVARAGAYPLRQTSAPPVTRGCGTSR